MCCVQRELRESLGGLPGGARVTASGRLPGERAAWSPASSVLGRSSPGQARPGLSVLVLRLRFPSPPDAQQCPWGPRLAAPAGFRRPCPSPREAFYTSVFGTCGGLSGELSLLPVGRAAPSPPTSSRRGRAFPGSLPSGAPYVPGVTAGCVVPGHARRPAWTFSLEDGGRCELPVPDRGLARRCCLAVGP